MEGRNGFGVSTVHCILLDRQPINAAGCVIVGAGTPEEACISRDFRAFRAVGSGGCALWDPAIGDAKTRASLKTSSHVWDKVEA